jgi:transposase, IS5 family
MIGKTEKIPQLNLFEVPLTNFINIQHELVILSKKIDWDEVEKYFKKYYSEIGRPSVPIRKMVGLILLKQVYNESDENVVDRWIENPYWQYFCGEVNFQKQAPFDPSEFVHFRKRIGEEGAEKLLQLSIHLYGKEVNVKEVLADTTVQEKNITFPTDTKLHKKIIDKCLKIAEKEEITLRQSYTRTVKGLMLLVRYRNNPKRKKKARAAARKIKTISGRLVRELSREFTETQLSIYKNLFSIFNQILTQTKTSKNKIYSIHEPDVKCIAKGKEHKPYEFGNKSSIVKTKNGIIVGAMAFKENIYDGDTLTAQLDQTERLTGKRPEVGIADRGYRGRKQIGSTQIVIPTPAKSQYQRTKQRKRFRARAGIEPIIGHIKHDHRMIRNYLRGTLGDAINTIIAAAAFNIKKYLNRIKKSVKKIFFLFWKIYFPVLWFIIFPEQKCSTIKINEFSKKHPF